MDLKTKIFSMLGIKHDKTLGEIDAKTLSQMDFMEAENPSLKNIDKALDDYDKCSDCKASLNIVNPETWMNDMVLCECPNCNKRCYKKL